MKKEIAEGILMVLVALLFLSNTFAHELNGGLLVPYLIAILLIVLFSVFHFFNIIKVGKSRVTTVSFVFFVLWFLQPGWLTDLSHKLAFKKIEKELVSFTNEIYAYKEIFSMSSGDRHFKELNGQLITYEKSEIKSASPGLRPIRYYKSKLIASSIDEMQYEHFREKLRSLNLIDFQVIGPLLAFTIDGFLDNCYGYIYSENVDTDKIMSKNTSCGVIVSVRQISEHWFYYGTS